MKWAIESWNVPVCVKFAQFFSLLLPSELMDPNRPMTAQTNAEAVEIPESARTVTEE